MKKNLDEKNEELEKEKSNRNMLEKERSAIQNKMKTMEEEATSIKKRYDYVETISITYFTLRN